MLPVPVFKYPLIFAPVAVTVSTPAVPPTPTVTFPPDVAIFTLLVPLLIPLEFIVDQVKPPEPSVLNNCPDVPPVI